MNKDRLDKIRQETTSNPTTVKIAETINKGWPSSNRHMDKELKQFYSYKEGLVLNDGLILKGERILIPETMKKEILEKIHTGHQRINSCLRRARELVCWPGMSTDIRNHVYECDTCRIYGTKQRKEETHIEISRPKKAWTKIGMDLFTIGDRLLDKSGLYDKLF